MKAYKIVNENLMGCLLKEEYFLQLEHAESKYNHILETIKKDEDFMQDEDISGLYFPSNLHPIEKHSKDDANLIKGVYIAMWYKSVSEECTEWDEEWMSLELREVEIKEVEDVDVKVH